MVPLTTRSITPFTLCWMWTNPRKKFRFFLNGEVIWHVVFLFFLLLRQLQVQYKITVEVTRVIGQTLHAWMAWKLTVVTVTTATQKIQAVFAQVSVVAANFTWYEHFPQNEPARMSFINHWNSPAKMKRTIDFHSWMLWFSKMTVNPTARATTSASAKRCTGSRHSLDTIWSLTCSATHAHFGGLGHRGDACVTILDRITRRTPPVERAYTQGGRRRNQA